MAVLAMAAVSCLKDNSSQVKEEGMSLMVSMPETVTRTLMGDKEGSSYPVLWSAGDVISVNGVRSLPLDEAAAGGTSASFFFEHPVAAPYNVTYGCFLGQDDIISIPSAQKMNALVSFSDGLMPMYATSMTEPHVKMQHLASVLRVTIAEEGKLRRISHVRVSSPEGNRISGIYRLGVSDGLFDGTAEILNGSAVITLAAGPDDMPAASSFIVLLAPGHYPEGLDVSVTDVDGKTMFAHVVVEKELVAGTVYETPEIEFTEDDAAEFLIRTTSDLAEFRTRVLAGEVTLSAVLVHDLSVEAGVWDTPLNMYQGTVDGAGHTISGLKCPMFNELRGIVRNLILDSHIEIELPSPSDTMWTGILAQRLAAGSGNNPHTGHVINCTSNGTLKVINTSTTKANANIGGIVGYMVRGSVTGCVNKADISVSAAASTKKVNVGGIIGRAYSGGAVMDIADCVNEGSITVSGTPSVYYAGGIIGESDTTSGTAEPNTIDNCLNFGVLTITAVPTSDGSKSDKVAGHSTNVMVNCF